MGIYGCFWRMVVVRDENMGWWCVWGLILFYELRGNLELFFKVQIGVQLRGV
jgi:hypothetical protein